MVCVCVCVPSHESSECKHGAERAVTRIRSPGGDPWTLRCLFLLLRYTAGRGGASVGARLPVKQFFYSVCFWLGLFAGVTHDPEKMLSSHIPNVKSHRTVDDFTSAQIGTSRRSMPNHAHSHSSEHLYLVSVFSQLRLGKRP